MKPEHVILRNLCGNEIYSRKVLPFLKDEYFTSASELIVLRLIREYTVKYNTLPPADVLLVEIPSIAGHTDDIIKAAYSFVQTMDQIPLNTNTPWLEEFTEKFCQDRAVYNAAYEAIEILEGKRPKIDKSAIPEMFKEALGVSFNTNIGHDYLEDWEARHDYRNDTSVRIPFDIEMFNKITKGGLPPKTLSIVAGGTNVGKAQPNYSMVATPSGWKKIGDLKYGEYVIGSNGLPTKVVGVYPRGILPIYRVTTWDGSSTLAADDHLWTVKLRGKWQTRTTKNLAKLNLKRGRIQLPSNSPVEFNKQELPLDPYILGLLVGDGCYSVKYSVSFSTMDKELIDYISQFHRVIPHKESKCDYYITGINSLLKESGLKVGSRSWEKEIPEKYLLGSSEDRLAVLQGLMDSDGYVFHKEGNASGCGTRCRFNSTSKKLCENVAYLVRSLGGVAKINERVPKTYTHNGEKRLGRPYFEVSVALSPDIVPFRLKRKVEKYNPKEYRTRIIRSIAPDGEAECTCIKVEASDSLYITEDFMVTHNTLGMCSFAAAHLALGYDVLYITLEMSSEAIGDRIDANLLDVGLDGLYNLNKPEFKQKVENLKRKTQGKLIIKEYPNGTASPTNFRALISELRLKKNFNPQIVYVDYLNICASGRLARKGVPTHEYVMSIAEELRAMGQLENLPVISATQLNREGFKDSDPDMDQIAQSFGLPMTVDFMVVLLSNDELAKLGQYIVKQLKSRFGNKYNDRAFVVGVDYDKQRLYDVEASAYENVGMKDITPQEPASETPGQLLMAKKPNKFSGFTV